MKLHEKIRSRLKLRDIQMLLTVAEHGSMAKAAGELNMTQSGVSRAIADLEHALGVHLFDRTAQGVEPTRAGRAMLRGGVAMLDDLRQSVEEIEHLSDPARGELTLGCTEPMAWGIVPAIIDRMVQRHPRMSFQLTQGDPQRLRFTELRERKIELALGAIVGGLSIDDLDTEVLFEDTRFVVAGRTNPLANRRRLSVSELSDFPWVIPTLDSPGRIVLDKLFQSNGLPMPRVSLVSFSLPLHLALLATGRFLTVLPHSMLQFCAQRMALKILPVELPSRAVPVGVSVLKGRTVSPIARMFIEQARLITKPLAMRSL